MAPELRKRKAAPEAKKSNGTPSKVVEKPAPKTKRKAADDASPVSLKKQKSTKKATIEDKPASNPAKATKTKKSTKKAAAKVKEVEAAPAEEASDAEEQEDDGMLLLADDLDSSDEDVADNGSLFKPGQDVGKIPEVSKEVLKAAKPTGERGIVYIGRIPHGFYEHEMRQYLSQFGPVTRLRLSRNKKTGASKHFAFVEFRDESTAEIVAKTMDGYLLFGHILKVKLVPSSQAHQELFKGANRRFKKVPWNKMAGQKLAKPQTESAWEAKVEKERDNRAKQAAKLKAIGYEFDAPELKEVPAPAPIEKEDKEVGAIEAAPSGNEDGGKADDADTTEPEAKDPEPEVKTILAPKAKATKAKAPKSGKAKKTKA
ncbi:Putative RNA-binding protein [Tolypocladium paradoxum]|uniref:RNA-binding protein n=1 Tax=Tolypocladium paradoxum TaxID=94208 RepID=A0A2S4KRZ8_9HYPO|nr:Putative RNA-binding protein [Tolypocladium paradoxum]